MTSSTFVASDLSPSAGPNARTDASRTMLLAATRNMTLLVMAGVPVIGIALVVFWGFWSTSVSPLALLLAVIGTFAACAVNAELWRRLERLSDVTALNEELRYRATHDLLMHVPNRDQLHVELAQALTASGGVAGRVGLLFLDLDNFKMVNDTLGHAAGDELLKAVASRMKRACAHENAVLARVGGDELVVLMRTLESMGHLSDMGDRVLAQFAEPFVIDGVELAIGTSVGMASSLAHETADDLYRHADAALYVAKERGRCQAVFADGKLRRRRDSRAGSELALRGALAGDEIEAWLQPEVDLVTGEIVAAEALARWRSGDNVEVADSFIDVVRRAGMLEQLMIEIALQLWEWRSGTSSTLPVALNVSAAHLPCLLALHKKDPANRSFANMRIEIAETDIISDFPGARQSLNQLRELGAGIFLDDFGAGYSSLQMLSDLPIDGIKIDSSYVARVESDQRVHSLVTSLAEFARNMNIVVVAEGIETSRQADVVTRMGIDRGQGFLFSRAIAPKDFAELLQEGPIRFNHAARF